MSTEGKTGFTLEQAHGAVLEKGTYTIAEHKNQLSSKCIQNDGSTGEK
jgi:hypothetical protein